MRLLSSTMVRRGKVDNRKHPRGIYLKGERETWNGINKFMITCPARGPITLYTIFDPGQNAKDVMQFGAKRCLLIILNQFGGRRLVKK